VTMQAAMSGVIAAEAPDSTVMLVQAVTADREVVWIGVDHRTAHNLASIWLSSDDDVIVEFDNWQVMYRDDLPTRGQPK